MRCSGGTNFGLERSVVTRTKSMIACFAGPSCHEANGSPCVTCARADEDSSVPVKAGRSARLEARLRRLTLNDDDELSDFIFISIGALVQIRAYMSRDKTRSRPFLAYVGFRRVQTCMPAGLSGSRCVTTRHGARP